ncbi:4Fe-4S binding protein [Methanobacterium sp. ACI-7]|uniref:4Fe-4S binding protein n=1 Tax=unclassified Methanobacterium TaxID=2627676 RepID=UPI0039C47769
MNKRQKIRQTTLLISFLLFPVTMFYFSPFLIIWGASLGIITGSFITFTCLFILSLFFGRAFCGWACPTGGAQEYCFSINDGKTRGGRYNWIKYFIFVPWMAIIVLMVILAGGFARIDPLFLTQYGVSISEQFMYIIYYGILISTILVAVMAGKRANCHYLCFIAPFMIIGTKIKNFFRWPSIHLEADNSLCVQCNLCKNCPMSIDVREKVLNRNMYDYECILCGKCVDSCPKGAIRYSFSLPKRGN